LFSASNKKQVFISAGPTSLLNSDAVQLAETREKRCALFKDGLHPKEAKQRTRSAMAREKGNSPPGPDLKILACSAHTSSVRVDDPSLQSLSGTHRCVIKLSHAFTRISPFEIKQK
jgi:hypothetical protein